MRVSPYSNRFDFVYIDCLYLLAFLGFSGEGTVFMFSFSLFFLLCVCYLGRMESLTTVPQDWKPSLRKDCKNWACLTLRKED